MILLRYSEIILKKWIKIKFKSIEHAICESSCPESFKTLKTFFFFTFFYNYDSV